MKNIGLLIISIVLLIDVNQLSAQTIINNDSVNKNRAYIRVGIEPATMLTLGYQRNLRPGFLKQPITAFGEWSVSAFRFSIKNSEFKTGGILPVFEKGNFKIVNNLNLSVGSVKTSHFNSKKFAIADEVAIGFYKKKWFFATTVEYEKILLNHIKNTDFYRETYYEDANDGWYKGAGGMFQFGIEGGRTFYEKYDVHLELKMPFTEKFNFYGGSPFHVNLGLAYRF